MSSALKALKKLHKKALKQERKASDRALQALSHQALPPTAPVRRNQETATNSVWGDVSQQVAGAMLGEIARPLRPLLAWFDGDDGFRPASHRPASKAWSSSMEKGSMRPVAARSSAPSILYLPLKSPPCKRCPARSGGICQCAAKRFG
ncbi:Uncharacterised protein [Leminorella richardii]|uniref:Uncharacterized protein n=1 Tax=Leminorella richardii TaxID=158841 RepID=A0A2X4X959_9GAMM|nr:hypothetical protein [Leminorella richardii]SQI36235.1 Uncharacterised protein [Leminorella richardii]